MENHQEISTLEIVQNKLSQRFEVVLPGGYYAFVEYRWSGRSLALLHTEVPQEWQNKGIAAHIVNHVLEYAQKEQLRIKPFCPYILSYINRNPQYQALTQSSLKPLA
jgi:predicted GNAT family acetyltransferase